MKVSAELKIVIDPGSKNPVTIWSCGSSTDVVGLINDVKAGVLDSLDMLGMTPANSKVHDTLYQEVGPVVKRKRKASSVVDLGNVIVGEYIDGD